MSNFNTNFSKILLLANKNIKFWTVNLELEFELIPIKTKDMFLNNNLIWFLNFLDEDLKNFQIIKENYNIKSHFDFIRIICAMSDSDNLIKDISEKFLKSFKILIPDIYLDNKILMIKDQVFTETMFNEIMEIIYKIIGKKEVIKILDSDDEMTQKMKRMQEKIAEIKKKGKKMNDSSTSFEDIFAALLYEFPQYKMQDLFELNIYTFYYLFKYVGKIANYEVSKIAAGNGLTKKHKYFIEK